MKRFKVLAFVFVVFVSYTYILVGWQRNEIKANTITPPVRYYDVLGKEITADSSWGEGVVFRTRIDGKTQLLIITKYHKK